MDFHLLTEKELLARFTANDYGVFLGMLAISGVIGLFYAFNGGPQNTTRQLLAADGQLPPLFVSLSLMASFISASYILGNAAEIFQNGTMYFFTLISYCLVIPCTSFLFAPIFYSCNVLSCYEYLEKRFNRGLRCIAVFFYIIQMLIYNSIQLFAPALALSRVTGMELWSAVFAIGLVCTAYTSVGGVKAVVYSDSFQAVCMMLAMLFVVIFGIKEVGGFKHVWNVAVQGGRIQFNEASLDPTIRHTMPGLIIGGFFTSMASYATNQMMVLRYFTVSSLPRARLVVLGNLPLLVIIFTLSSLSGLAAYAYFSGCDPVIARQIKSHDELLPYFVMTVLGKYNGYAGIFVAGIFAASLSSISSGVNALANVVYVDIISLIWPKISNQTGARVINGLGIVFGLLSIVLVYAAQSMGDVLQATNAINSGIGGPLLGLFSVGMFLPHVNTKGATAGFVASLAVSLWMNLRPFFAPVEQFPLLPISVEQCMNATLTAWGTENFVLPVPQQLTQDSSFDINNVSYIWFTAIAVVVSFLVAIPVSYLSGLNNPRTIDPTLIARPFDALRSWLPSQTCDRLAFNVGADFCNNREWTPTSLRDGDRAVYDHLVSAERPCGSSHEHQDIICERF